MKINKNINLNNLLYANDKVIIHSHENELNKSIIRLHKI
jgi:hypothetical protein